MPGIFVSYRRKDTAGHAGRVFDRLRDHFGATRVFRDVNVLKGGEDFVEALARAVDSCQVFIVVIGREWFDARDDQGRRRLDDPRDFIRLEVETALRRKVLVLPVLVEGAVMPDLDDLPEPLRPLARRQAIELSDHRWDFDTQELITRIEEVIGRPHQRGKHLAFWGAAAAAMIATVATSTMWWPYLRSANAPSKVESASSPLSASPNTQPSPGVLKDVGTAGFAARPASSAPIDAGRGDNAPTPARAAEPPPSKSADPPTPPGTAKPAEPSPVEPPKPTESSKAEALSTLSNSKPPESKASEETKPVEPPKPPEPSKPRVPTVQVPDFSGESLRGVNPRIQGLGLRVKSELNSTARVAPGTVYAQRPRPGSLVELGSVIELFASTSLQSNEHAAGSVYLRPKRAIDIDDDGEGREGWDFTLLPTDRGYSLAFGNGARGAQLPPASEGRGRFDPASCERVGPTSSTIPISDGPGQTVCMKTTSGRTAAISIGRFQPDPPEVFITYSTLAARAPEPRPPVVDSRPPINEPRPPRDQRLSAAVCAQALQGRIAWDYSGTTRWATENVERLCRGASDDQPARCFNRVMHGGINWGGGTRWEWRNAIDLCEGTTNADATVACFQRYVGGGRPWGAAIAACDERRVAR
jgi:hypothetical protein